MSALDPKTPIGSIIKGVVSDIPASCIKFVREDAKNDDPKAVDLWAKILMACTMDQVNLLQHIWHRYPPDDTVTPTWFTIVQRGFFTEFLEPDLPGVRERFLLCHACVDAGKTIEAIRERQSDGGGPGRGRRKAARA